MCPTLTIIIPVYNEEKTVSDLLRRVKDSPYPDKQIVVVDDGSTDGTAAALAGWKGAPGVHLVSHSTNRGKGAAVRTGLQQARGAVTLIQDADLEYDPNDYPLLVEPILRGEAAVVYGSRYLASSGIPWTRFRAGVIALNVLVQILYRCRLTDEATCYKAAPTRLWRALDLEAERFELCAEVTAKVCRLGLRIDEVPVRYSPRTTAEGKKIGWADVWPTVWTLLRWRFLPLIVTDLTVPTGSDRQFRALSLQ